MKQSLMCYDGLFSDKDKMQTFTNRDGRITINGGI